MRPAAKSKTAVKVASPRAPLIEIFDDFDQGSDEWYSIRIGMVTASNLSAVMAGVAGTAEPGLMRSRNRLLYNLAAEILTGQPADTFSNAAMERGKAMEPAALAHFAFVSGLEVRRVGFVRRTIFDPLYGDRMVGCSPDGLLGDDGVLEIKTMEPGLIVELSESGRFPSEHRAQCQGSLWVTGRDYCILKIYYDGMPLSPQYRIARDEAYIRTMETAVETFQFDLAQLVRRLKIRGGIK